MTSQRKAQQKQQYCAGCRDDYYNHGGNGFGGGKCWNLKSARVVKRWKLGWWTTPDTPGAFQEVKTLTCHHAPGRYAMQTSLPSFALNPSRLKKASTR